MDISIAQKNGGRTAQFALLVVDVSNIQLIEKESETVGLPCIGNLAEQNDGLRTFASAELAGLREFCNAADNDPDATRNRHPNHRLTEEIGGYMIIHNDDAGRPEKRDPGLQNLSVDQPIVDSHEGYIQ